MKNGIWLLLLALLAGGCVSEEERKAAAAKQEKVVRIVQNAESVEAGKTVAEQLALLLNQARSEGKKIEIVGWRGVEKYVPGEKESGYDVYFDYREDGKKVRLFWVVKQNGEIEPLGERAQAVTRPGQKAEL